MGDNERSLPSLSNDIDGLQQGDSRQLRSNIRELFGDAVADSKFIDVTITSPPYSDLIEYDTDRDTQVGFGDAYEDYIEDLRTIFRQTYELTKLDGSLWVIVNSFRERGRFVDLPGDIVQICENIQGMELCPDCGTKLAANLHSMSPTCHACGYATIEDSWSHHDTIIWDKVRARPYANKTFRNVFEYILCFTKSDGPAFDFDSVRIADESELEQWWVDWPERYNPRGKIPDNVWEMVTPTQGGWNQNWPGHPAPFPPQLVERIVQLTTEEGGMVFDPFGGSGTTVAQAMLMGRRGLGFEISDTYLANYGDVLEYLRKRWQERQASNETLELQQDRLARTIWGLRQLVYAKKASTQLRTEIRDRDSSIDTIADLGLHSIIVDSEIPDPSMVEGVVKTMETAYTYVFDPDVDGSQYLDRLEAMAAEEPWNGFKINPTIRTKSLLNIDYGSLPTYNGGPYIYTNGQHEQVARALSEQAWGDARNDPERWRSHTASNYCPALVSNVLVYVERSDSGPKFSEQLLDNPPASDTEFGTTQIQSTEDHINTSLSNFF
ncbi:DNA-methyltransferase [Haloprofundus salinisoli]|uniref:DNA-methyltransferase n=1 Tax=Haloprofundus salinisoli TaxID=2876193 RepID=UPI001CCB1F6B|nr:site-specific DNA-methyltransferase [Haloprofundus salinisoli]